MDSLLENDEILIEKYEFHLFSLCLEHETMQPEAGRQSRQAVTVYDQIWHSDILLCMDQPDKQMRRLSKPFFLQGMLF